MAQTLFDYNHHVLAGDVLLLRSAGPRALGNRFGQRALRLMKPLRTAKFTHVALVISPTHIADAMPEEGVQMHSWRDAAGNYDLDKCVVVRHPALLSLAYDSARLIARVQYYYAQRYTLMSLARRTVKHNKGVVCSQFVALVLHDLGLPPLATTAMWALPSDIDHNTRGKNGWRQFPFSNYGWHPAVSPPPAGDAYWRVLADSLPSLADFAEDDESASKPPRSAEMNTRDVHLATTFHKDDSPAIDQETTALNPTEASIRLSGAISQNLASSMGTTEAFLRVFAELDRQMLAIADALTKGQDRPQKEGLLDLSQESLDGLSECKLSGRSLLEQWHSLYIDESGAPAKVLADADAPQRLAQHRVLLGKNIEGLTQAVTTANDRTRSLQEHLNQISVLLQRGSDVPLELISLMHQGSSIFLKSMDWLEDESADAILARCDGYAPLVSNTLMPLLPKLRTEVGLQALDQLDALLVLDEQCWNWVSTAKPILLHVMGSLASVLSNR